MSHKYEVFILGVRLLDRTAQGVELTRYGEILFRRGLAVFEELRQSVKRSSFWLIRMLASCALA